MSGRIVAATLCAGLLLVACGGDGDESGPLTMVVYDSFTDEGPLNDALAEFTGQTGIDVRLVVAGDTGTMVSKAVLTAGNPEGDVMFGVDSTFLSRVVDEDVFVAYTADGLDAVPAWMRRLVPDHELTPVDFGDVCVNVDSAWFAANGVEPPTSLADLTDERYRDLLVVQNPATSSVGLAFLLATVAAIGDDEWPAYWADLRANGVEVVDGWTESYYERFSGASDGDRPLVVSYGTSPPAEVVFAETPIERATTTVLPDTCFRQVEFAGVLRGTQRPDAAGRLVDFLVSARFQQELPLSLFVYPANEDVGLPAVFTENAIVPADPATVDPATIAANREAWIDEWTDVVVS